MVQGSPRSSSAKTVAIVQSSYIPWKGYFDLIESVDEFILFDDVQFTKRDWRSRNMIKTRSGPRWLTVPVSVSGKYEQLIQDTRVADKKWAMEHWNTIQHSYARAPFFKQYSESFYGLYREGTFEYLSEINFHFISSICELMNIRTPLRWSSELPSDLDKTERLIDICQRVGAARYVSGPKAKAYLKEDDFAERHIALSYFDYEGYPEYEQLYPPFTHNVSVIDLLFHTGPKARDFFRKHDSDDE